VVDVIIRSEKSFFFAAERDEDEGALQLWSLRAKDACYLDQSGGA
jgi:hypothetical protein